jgi:hypothetical protein
MYMSAASPHPADQVKRAPTTDRRLLERGSEMGQDQDVRPAGTDTADQGDKALTVLRNIWGAQAQTSAELDEACGNTKICKNTANLGFRVTDDDEGDSLRASWRAKLEREGKLPPEATSVRELILGDSEPAR